MPADPAPRPVRAWCVVQDTADRLNPRAIHETREQAREAKRNLTHGQFFRVIEVEIRAVPAHSDEGESRS